MSRTHGLRRSALRLMVLTVLGVGIAVAAVPAEASCAGPQLRFQQAGEYPTPSRVGEGSLEKVVYPVDSETELLVIGENLTTDCVDTAMYGCSGPPVGEETIKPLHDPVLILEQDGREWKLAEIGAVGPDLAATVTVTMPSAVKPGPATLAIIDSRNGDGQTVDLKII